MVRFSRGQASVLDVSYGNEGAASTVAVPTLATEEPISDIIANLFVSVVLLTDGEAHHALGWLTPTKEDSRATFTRRARSLQVLCCWTYAKRWCAAWQRKSLVGAGFQAV